MHASGKRNARIELFATLLLAVAAVATAWSTFQSTRLRGDQAVHTGHANADHIESSEASTRATQLTQIDVATFMQWINAHAAGDANLAQFYRRRFRTEFQPAFASWLAMKPFTNPGAPKTPFELSQYRVAEAAKADALNVSAGVESDAASVANRRADDYMLAVVLFASCLFFAGISTKLGSERLREVLLGVGVVIFVGTAVWVATLPVGFTS